MKKVLIFFVVVAFTSKVNTQQPSILPVINFDMSEFNAHAREHEQMQMQEQGPEQPHMHMEHMPDHQQGREAENDQMLGGPLFGGPLRNNWAFSPLNPRNPFGLKIPGLRFSNIQAGHLGPIAFGNSLLGAENPMSNDEEQPMPPHMQHQMEQQLGSHHLQEAEPEVGSVPQSQGFLPLWWLHLANPDSNLGAPVPLQQLQSTHLHHHHSHLLGAPNMQQMDQQLGSPQAMEFGAESPQMFQVGAPQMMPFGLFPLGPQMEMPNDQQQPEDSERTFGNMFKG